MYVFIGCSSHSNIDDVYVSNARLVAAFLAKTGFNLITGGINGVMGVVQEEFAKFDRDINIYEIDYYKNKDDCYKYSLLKYKNVGSRKQAIISKANIIIIMPGGIGTLDELFTFVESKRTHEHNCPIIILNINHYYDDLVKMLEHMYNNNFIDKEDKKYYNIANSFDEFTTIFSNIDWNDLDE